MCFFLSRKNSQKNFPPPVNQKFENGDQQLTSRKVLTSIALYSEPSESRALEKRFMNVLGNAQQFLYSQTYKSLNCLDSLYLSFLSFFFFVFDFRSLRENLDQLPVIQPQPLPECKHLKLSPKTDSNVQFFVVFVFVLFCFVFFQSTQCFCTALVMPMSRSINSIQATIMQNSGSVRLQIFILVFTSTSRRDKNCISRV